MSELRSLTERLGYAPGTRLLVVNCDDLGSSHSANVAALRAIRDGIGTSATLMVPCPWAREAVAFASDIDIGVHLTLTAEYPGYRWRSLTGARSLHDSQGYLPRTTAEVFAHARVEDVEAECRAQIDQALGWGIDVTHLDAHMGTMQIDPRYFAIYLKLAEDYALPLRMVSANQEKQLGFPGRKMASQKEILFPDNFISPWGRPSDQVFRETLASLRSGVTEIYLHPVEDGPELRAYDDEHADVRVADCAVLLDAELRNAMEKAHIVPLSFRRLRELQRGKPANAPC